MLIVMLRLGTWESACLVVMIKWQSRSRVLNQEQSTWWDGFDRKLHVCMPRYANFMAMRFELLFRCHLNEWTTSWLVMQNVPAGLVWSTIVVSSFSFSPFFASLVSEAKCNRKDLKRYSAFLIWQQSKSQLTDYTHIFYIIRCLIDNN